MQVIDHFIPDLAEDRIAPMMLRATPQSIDEATVTSYADKLGLQIDALLTVANNGSELISALTDLASEQNIEEAIQWIKDNSVSFVLPNLARVGYITIFEDGSVNEIRLYHGATGEYILLGRYDIYLDEQLVLNDSFDQIYSHLCSLVGASEMAISIANEVLAKGESALTSLETMLSAKMSPVGDVATILEDWFGPNVTSLGIADLVASLDRAMGISTVPTTESGEEFIVDPDLPRYATLPALSVFPKVATTIATGLVTAVTSIFAPAIGVAVNAVSSAINYAVEAGQRYVNTSTQTIINGEAVDYGYANSLKDSIVNTDSAFWVSSLSDKWRVSTNTKMAKRSAGPVTYLRMPAVTNQGRPVQKRDLVILKLTPFLHPDRVDAVISDMNAVMPYRVVNSVGNSFVYARFEGDYGEYTLVNYDPSLLATDEEIRDFSEAQLLRSYQLSITDLIIRRACMHRAFEYEDSDGFDMTKPEGSNYYFAPHYDIGKAVGNPEGSGWTYLNNAIDFIYNGSNQEAWAAEDILLSLQSGEYDSSEYSQKIILPDSIYLTDHPIIPYFVDNGIPYCIPPLYNKYNPIPDILATGLTAMAIGLATAGAFALKRKIRDWGAVCSVRELQGRSDLANGTINASQYSKLYRNVKLSSTAASVTGAAFVGSVGLQSAATSGALFTEVVNSVVSSQELEQPITDANESITQVKNNLAGFSESTTENLATVIDTINSTREDIADVSVEVRTESSSIKQLITG